MPSSKDPVINRQKAKEWRLAHPEEHRKANMLWLRRKRYQMGKEWAHEQRHKKALQDPIGHLFKIAERRAKKFGIPFAITREDLVMPEVCPVLGTPWRREPGVMGWRNRLAPTLDRVRPELGYVPGNVFVISTRANRVKADASLEELEALVAYMKRVGW